MREEVNRAQNWKLRFLFYAPLPIVAGCSIFRAIRDLTPGLAAAFTGFVFLLTVLMFLFLRSFDHLMTTKLPVIKSGNLPFYLGFWLFPTLFVLMGLLSLTSPFRFMFALQLNICLVAVQTFAINFLRQSPNPEAKLKP